jgi:hypothetical protein
MNWRTALLVVGAILITVLFVLVMLVLTGIIAEPETVIESIVRSLSGG